MQKASKVTLACGHPQNVSPFRYSAARGGAEQGDVWCVTCNGWTQLYPFATVVDDMQADPNEAIARQEMESNGINDEPA